MILLVITIINSMFCCSSTIMDVNPVDEKNTSFYSNVEISKLHAFQIKNQTCPTIFDSLVKILNYFHKL